jgi:hypothetical protein
MRALTADLDTARGASREAQARADAAARAADARAAAAERRAEELAEAAEAAEADAKAARSGADSAGSRCVGACSLRGAPGGVACGCVVRSLARVLTVTRAACLWAPAGRWPAAGAPPRSCRWARGSPGRRRRWWLMEAGRGAAIIQPAHHPWQSTFTAPFPTQRLHAPRPAPRHHTPCIQTRLRLNLARLPLCTPRHPPSHPQGGPPGR